jgi:hypothetical protein
MKIISNDLYCGIERWDDPGDYPNGLASGPLPSHHYCEYGGEFVFEAENDEELKELDNVDDWIGDWVNDKCDITSYTNPSYHCEVEGNRCVVTITSADPEEPEYDGPDRPEDDY